MWMIWVCLCWIMYWIRNKWIRDWGKAPPTLMRQMSSKKISKKWGGWHDICWEQIPCQVIILQVERKSKKSAESCGQKRLHPLFSNHDERLRQHQRRIRSPRHDRAPHRGLYGTASCELGRWFDAPHRGREGRGERLVRRTARLLDAGACRHYLTTTTTTSSITTYAIQL